MKIIIIIILFLSCQDNQIKTISSFYDNGDPKIIEFYNIFLNDSTLIMKQELYKNGNIKYQNIFNNKKSRCSSYSIDGIIKEEKFFTNNILDSINKYDIRGEKIYIKQ